MKTLLMTLIFLPMAAFANTDAPLLDAPLMVFDPPAADLPEMTWAFRPYIRAGTILSIQDAKRMIETTQQAAISLTDPNTIDEMIVNIGKGIMRLSSLSEEEAAIEIVNSIFSLSEVAEHLKQTKVNAGVAVSLVVFPTPVQSLDQAVALDDFATFSKNLLAGMNQVQQAAQSNPAKDRDWYFLGAVANIKVATRDSNDMHLQLVLGLRPKVIEQDGNRIEIPVALRAEDAPVAIIDVTMPMDVTLPTISLTFGRLGELQSAKSERLNLNGQKVSKTEWRFRFTAQDGSLCSRAGSVPLIYKKVEYRGVGTTMVVPLYSAEINGNDQVMTNADARLAGPWFAPIGCWKLGGMVSSQVVKTVNDSISKSMNDNGLFALFRLSLRDLAEHVQRLKEQAHTNVAP